MNPELERLDRPVRRLDLDAFFVADRAAGPPSARAAAVITLKPPAKGEAALSYDTAALTGARVEPAIAPSAVSVPTFPARHDVKFFPEFNPLPHARRLPGHGGGPGAADSSVAGWKHSVLYGHFLSQAARALTATSTSRLKVRVLFGTGSEALRHGVCGAIDASTEAILLIIVPGIEPQHTVTLVNPADPSDRRSLTAHNRWGVGITVQTVEAIITQRYGRLLNYDITVFGAFSTGYLGLQESILRKLLPLDQLERVVIYDCLYATLKPALERVKAMKGNVHIIAYVVTQGGNSFTPANAKVVSFAMLTLGRLPIIHYINLMGSTAFHAITSARIVDEGRVADAPILTALTLVYAASLDALVAQIPPRNTVVSNGSVFAKVRGSLPSTTTTLDALSRDRGTLGLIADFEKHVVTTRRCIGRGQLLGWAAPPGEEWHDMLLIEFAWEYLS